MESLDKSNCEVALPNRLDREIRRVVASSEMQAGDGGAAARDRENARIVAVTDVFRMNCLNQVNDVIGAEIGNSTGKF